MKSKCPLSPTFLLLTAGSLLITGCGPRETAEEGSQNETIVVAPNENETPAPQGDNTTIVQTPASTPAGGAGTSTDVQVNNEINAGGSNSKNQKSQPSKSSKAEGGKTSSQKTDASQQKKSDQTQKQQSPGSAASNQSPPSKGAASGKSNSSSGRITAEGTVKNVAEVPRPGSVPYREALIAVHLTNVKPASGSAPKEMVVYMWGIKNNKETSAAKIQEGQNIRLTLQPWDQVEDQYGNVNRIELDSPDTSTLDTYWGETK